MIDWGALLNVVLVSLAAGVAVIVLVALALVGLGARVPATADVGVDGDGEARRSPLSPAVGTAVAVICLLAAVLIVGYGLYIIIS